MPPFFQFRVWAREAPGLERVLAALAVACVLVLVAVALVPVGQDDGETQAVGTTGGLTTAPAAETGSTAGGAGPAATGEEGVADVDDVERGPGATPDGSAVAGGGPGGGDGGEGGGGGAEGAPGAAPAGAQGPDCSGLVASGPGVTAEEVNVDVSLISLAGPIGNSTFDIRPDLPEIAQAQAKEINRTGGVACGRKLVLKIYEVNPLDPNDSQAKCLQMAADKPFLVLDLGGYLREANRACFVRQELPIITTLAFGSAEAEASFPYLLTPRNLSEEQIRNGILGLHARGFFDGPGFRKIGLFLDSCIPGVAREIDASLAAVGIPTSKISKFTMECAVSAPPNQIAQAVLQHRGDGATHVFLASSATNGQNYVRIAAGQNFTPIYGVSDYGENTTPSGTRNWHASFAGAIGVTSQHVGEVNSGMRSPEVQRCDETARRHGIRGFESEQEDTALVGLCDLFTFFRSAIDQGGKNPTRASFVEGISRIGTFKTASIGDGIFDRPGKVHGGDFQRAIRFDGSCSCWKVGDDFQPAFGRPR